MEYSTELNAVKRANMKGLQSEGHHSGDLHQKRLLVTMAGTISEE